MRRTALGIALATLAGFVWGMLYWGFNPLPYTAWKRAEDDVAAGRALRAHFPEHGTYYLPSPLHDRETLERLHETGPIAFVHVTDHDGRPLGEPLVLVKGALLILAYVSVLALLMQRTAQPSYGGRVAVAALAGLAAALVIDVGGAVWWYLPLAWKLHQACYDFTAFLVPGLVLARFVAPGAGGG